MSGITSITSITTAKQVHISQGLEPGHVAIELEDPDRGSTLIVVRRDAFLNAVAVLGASVVDEEKVQP